MKSCFASLVSKYVCDDCKPTPAVKPSKSSTPSVSQYFTSIRPFSASAPQQTLSIRHQKVQKSVAQLRAEKLKKNAEKARKQREKRAELRAKAEAAKQKSALSKYGTIDPVLSLHCLSFLSSERSLNSRAKYHRRRQPKGNYH